MPMADSKTCADPAGGTIHLWLNRHRVVLLIGVACLVIGLVGLWSADAVRAVRAQRNREAAEGVLRYVKRLGDVAADYHARHGQWPESLSDLMPREEAILPDPWGSPFRCQVRQNVCTVSSAGPDRVFGTEDDIVTVVTSSAPGLEGNGFGAAASEEAQSRGRPKNTE